MSRWRGFVVIVVRFHELHGARSNRSKDAIHGTASKQIPRSARADHLTESIDNGGQAKLALRICEFPGATSVRSRFSTRRSEEHTSELQSRLHLVCRLLLEKKKKLQHQ